MKEVNDAFFETSKILLGEGLGLEAHREWLSRHVPLPVKRKSAHSKKEVWVQPPLNFLGQYFDEDRIIDMNEIEDMNRSPFDAGDLEGADVQKVLEIMRPIVYYCGNLRYKQTINLEEVSGAGEVMNVFHSEDAWYGSKNVAFSNFAIYSENLFGCHMMVYSKFCINSYNSTHVTRGFEVDGCEDSSDVYFCHNSDGLRNCILCFNAKGLKYAVGNVEVGKEEFERVKGMILDYVLKNLRKEKKLDVDIFNVGCYGGATP